METCRVGLLHQERNLYLQQTDILRNQNSLPTRSVSMVQCFIEIRHHSAEQPVYVILSFYRAPVLQNPIKSISIRNIKSGSLRLMIVNFDGL